MSNFRSLGRDELVGLLNELGAELDTVGVSLIQSGAIPRCRAATLAAASRIVDVGSKTASTSVVNRRALKASAIAASLTAPHNHGTRPTSPSLQGRVHDTATQVLDVVERYFTRSRIEAKTQFFIEQLFPDR